MKLYVLAFLIASCAAAQDAPKPQFTARELFYSAAQAPPPAPAAAPSRPAGKKKKSATQVASKARPAPSPVPAPPADVATPTPPPMPDALPGGVHVIPAIAVTAPAPAAGPALGMRYTILRRTGAEMVEVAPDTIFHASDRIQFSVETNGPGYLYVVSQGSSGTWKPVFPSADVEEGNNHVEGMRTYEMPPKSRLVFDEQAGTEKIFIVLSREPEPNLENVIYSLQAPKAKPAATPAAAPDTPKQLLVASIDDGVVGLLRNSYSRDLIVEKVDENTPGDKKEKATYVV